MKYKNIYKGKRLSTEEEWSSLHKNEEIVKDFIKKYKEISLMRSDRSRILVSHFTKNEMELPNLYNQLTSKDFEEILKFVEENISKYEKYKMKYPEHINLIVSKIMKKNKFKNEEFTSYQKDYVVQIFEMASGSEFVFTTFCAKLKIKFEDYYKELK